jgi:hypothetical protein
MALLSTLFLSKLFKLLSNKNMTDVSDVEHFLEGVVHSAYRVGEDIASAGFLAGKELTEEIGLATEFWEHIRSIQQKQFSLLLEDCSTSFTTPSGRSPGEILLDHIDRRVELLNMGAKETLEVVAKELERFWYMERSLWIPFFRLLGRDAHSV